MSRDKLANRSRFLRAALLAATISGFAATSVFAASPVVVQMNDYDFAPAQLTVAAGSTVRFENNSKNPHMATDVPADALGKPVSGPQGFNTGIVFPGKSKEITFTKAGNYAYVCPLHDAGMMHMVGTLVVK